MPTAQLFDPAWSPDGTKLAFTRTADYWNNCDIYIARADGSGEQRITTSAQPWCANSPAWSPDGSKIAFYAGCASQCFGSNIYVVNADGSNQHALFTPVSVPFDILVRPTWSPDGSRIAFECGAYANGLGPDGMLSSALEMRMARERRSWSNAALSVRKYWHGPRWF